RQQELFSQQQSQLNNFSNFPTSLTNHQPFQQVSTLFPPYNQHSNNSQQQFYGYRQPLTQQTTSIPSPFSISPVLGPNHSPNLVPNIIPPPPGKPLPKPNTYTIPSNFSSIS